MILLSCQKQERFAWSGFSWENTNYSKVIIENTTSDIKSIRISYFNKTTKEVLDSTLSIAPHSKNVLGFEFFRPELINISYGEINKTTYLVPTMDLELLVSDTITTQGKHSTIYSTLFNVGDNSKTISELEVFLKNAKTPEWMTSFLLESRKYKELYEVYHQAGYELYLGNTDVTVNPQDSIKAEMLLKKQITGVHYNYYSLLQKFKNFYQFRKQNRNLLNEPFRIRQNFISELQSIEDDKTRYNMIGMHTEGLMLRKRKEFKDKDVLYTSIIGLLPEEYIDKLNKIEKEYTNDDYDTEAIARLLSKEVKTTTGLKSPLNETLKDYKLLKFWFAGCAPCKKEIPHENKLLNEYDNLSILHFCKSTKETDWREYISDNHSKGIHYYLDQEITKEYITVFNLSYAPRYVLLNKNNDVVCWNCANPSNKTLGQVLDSN